MKKVIGVNPVIEALKNKETEIEKLELYKGLHGEAINEIKKLASKRNVKIFYVSKRFEGTQGIALYISEYNYYLDQGEFLEELAKLKKSTVLILDGVQDPRNFGAIIRSAECFGVDGIIIPERNSVKINETVVKTSTGAVEYVPIVKVRNISEYMKQLKKLDFWIYGSDGYARTSYASINYPEKVALVLGSEGQGVRKKVLETCDETIKIPMQGRINSLNVSVACGVLLGEIAKRNIAE